MKPQADANLEAEQAVLSAVLCDPEAMDGIADLFRPEVFSQPHHALVATEVADLVREQKPIDPVLVGQRLQARGADVSPVFVLELARSIGSAANVRHYAVVLQSLWARREAKRVAMEMLRADLDESGEEFVGRFAQRLSAIETRNAKPVQKLGDVVFKRLERREELQKHPEMVQAWPSGFNQLDAITGGFQPGQLFVIAARQGTGKTAIMASVLKTLGMRKVPTGIFMLEDYAEALGDRTLMREGRIASPFLRDSVRWTKEVWTRAAAVTSRVAEWPIFIDDQHGQTGQDIAGKMRRMVRDHGVKVFFLDNLSEVLVDRQDRTDERHDQALGRIAKLFRDTAKNLGAAPVLIVHLSRKAEEAKDGRPQIFHIKNSGEIEEAAWVIALMARDRDSTELKVFVDKNRNGPPGEFTLFYDKDHMEVRNGEAQ